jgi:transposase-like protein
MYLQGVSTRRVTDITEALCGTAVSAGRLSRLNHKVGDELQKWRERPLARKYTYLYLDGMVLKARWAEHVERVSLLVAVGVNESGHREVLGVDTGCAEDMASWHQLLRTLKLRGLREVDLVIADAHAGLRQAAEAVFPQSSFQRCIFHFMQNVLTKVPRRMRPEIATALRGIFAQTTAADAVEKAKRFLRDYARRLPDAVAVLSIGLDDALTYYRFPPAHWHCIRTNNPLERTLREVQRRLRVVGAFPDVASALLLATARLKWTQETKWTDRVYLNLADKQLAA